jgi:hypothetical protein
MAANHTAARLLVLSIALQPLQPWQGDSHVFVAAMSWLLLGKPHKQLQQHMQAGHSTLATLYKPG